MVGVEDCRCRLQMKLLADPTYSVGRKSSPSGKLLPPVGRLSGRHSEGVTPVPIPNTAVKPLSADGTVPEGGTGE